MTRSLFLFLAMAGLSVAAETPRVPNGEAISAVAPLEEALNCIRQGESIPEQVERKVLALPAETIHGRLGKPLLMMGDEWIYLDQRSSRTFSIRVKHGRVESFGYHYWW